MSDHIVTVVITFPIGAANHSLKGLIHFFEHYLLKAKYINGENLLDRLDGIGINVNAATSYNHLRLYLQTSKEHLMKVIQYLFESLDYLQNTEKLDRQFVKKEKKLIFSEMELSKEKNKIESSILGNRQSVSSINEHHIFTVGCIFSQLMPVIEITNGELTALEVSIVKNCLAQKRLATRKEYQLMSFGNKRSNTKIMENFLTNLYLTEPLNNLLQSDITQNFMKKILRRQLILYSNEKKVVKYICKYQSKGFQIVLVKRNWTSETEHIGALSFKLNAMLRTHIQSIQYVLKEYLLGMKERAGTFQFSSETGAMTIFFQGTKDQLSHAITHLVNLDEEFIRDQLVQLINKRKLWKLETINDYAQKLIDENQPIDFNKEKIACFFKKSLLDATIVTSIERIEELLDPNEEKASKYTVEKKRNYVETFGSIENSAGSQSKNHEYIQIFSGPNYFSKEKFSSHIVWQIIDGISGQLYKHFSLDKNNFYSFKYFPRELVDGGYLVLYVFDKDREIDVGDEFTKLISKLSLSLSKRDFQAAKLKLLMSKQFSETVGSQLLSLSLHSLYGYEYISYEEGIQTVSYDSVKEFLKKMLKARTIII